MNVGKVQLVHTHFLQSKQVNALKAAVPSACNTHLHVYHAERRITLGLRQGLWI